MFGCKRNLAEVFLRINGRLTEVFGCIENFGQGVFKG